MVKKLLVHLRGNVVVYLVLAGVLSGTSFAAASRLLPANSVGTKQVINHSLLRKDFKTGQLPKGAKGAQGAPGPQGPRGAKGDTGPSTGSAGGDLSGIHFHAPR